MLGKILNFGKKQEFYLTIDEIQETDSTATENVTATVAEAPTKLKEVVESTPTPEANVETAAKPKAKSTNTQPSKKTVEAKSQVTTKPKSEKKPAAPVYGGASSWEEPFWVKAMYNNTASENSNDTAVNTEKTFATDYLLVQSSSRRRPGPSVDKFKGMVTKKRF